MPRATSSTRVFACEFVIMPSPPGRPSLYAPRPGRGSASHRPLAKEGEHVEIPGRLTIFRQRDRGFSSELRPMIHDMNEHVPQDVLERNALGGLVVELCAETVVGQGREVGAHLALFLSPPGLQCVERRELALRREGGHRETFLAA